MSYESAPATRMLATHCACCSRPLVDARSVEVGMGPHCRRKHGFDDGPEENREAANRIVHAVALARSGGAPLEGDWDALTASTALAGLGFRRLAAVLAERAATVRIEEGAFGLLVFAPFSEAALDGWRDLRARWDRERKCRVVAFRERAALWTLLREHFAGACAVGPRGPFRIGAADVARAA